MSQTGLRIVYWLAGEAETGTAEPNNAQAPFRSRIAASQQLAVTQQRHPLE